MKTLLDSIHFHHGLPLAQEPGTVSGKVVLDTGLSVEFREDLLPEELEYVRDGAGFSELPVVGRPRKFQVQRKISCFRVPVLRT